MSHWNRWSRRKRVLLVVLATVVLVTTTWVAISGAAASSSRATELDAPIPPPQDVFIQQRENVDGFGNAYVLIKLSTAQVSAKRAEGTADFLTLGTSTDMAILRDDGQGGDVAAGDGLYTGIATVDHAALQRRAALDQQELSDHPSQLVPLFQGRAAVGIVRPAAFDYDSFAAGKVVRLGPAVSFLGPESEDPSVSGATPVNSLHSSGIRSMTAAITSTNPVVPGTNQFQNRVLMINNTSVIADSTRTWNPCTNTGTANGVWTFNHLMTQMVGASGIPPGDFVENWLQNWLNSSLVINADPVTARTRMNHIINQWPRVGGKLDLTKSPLRLLAIVPRLDLRKTTGGGGGYSPSSGNFLDAGELRFIFGFVAKQTTTFNPATAFTGAVPIGSSTCYALPFSVIFEYRVPKNTCQTVKTWAQGWKDLNNYLPGNSGTPSYNSKLQALTQQVVVANADPNRTNGSALGQLRTNEVALADVTLGDPWELRQFNLQSGSFGFLIETPVEDTIRNDPSPGGDYNRDNNGTGLLSSWISTVIKPLLASNNEATIPLVPLFYQGQPFLAGDSRVPEPNTGPGTGPNYITFHWTDPDNLDLDPNNANNDNAARHRVSRASCNGCHRRETFTHFVHVNPADTILLSTWDDGVGDWTYPAGGPIAIVRSNPTLPAELSSFLTGINQLGDPGNADENLLDIRSPNAGDPKRNFDDLARREQDLTGVAGMSCSGMSQVNVAHVKNHVLSTGRLPVNLFEGMAPQPVSKQVQVGIDDIKRNPIFEVH